MRDEPEQPEPNVWTEDDDEEERKPRRRSSPKSKRLRRNRVPSVKS